MTRISFTKEPERFLPVLFVLEAFLLFIILQNLFKGYVVIKAVILPNLKDSFTVMLSVHMVLMLFILNGKQYKRKIIRMSIIYVFWVFLAAISSAKWYNSAGINGLIKSFIVFVPMNFFVYKAYKHLAFSENVKYCFREMANSFFCVSFGCFLQYVFSYIIVYFNL